MRFLPPVLTGLLFFTLTGTSCQSDNSEAALAADLNSTNLIVAAQAQKVQQLMGQLKQQQAVIESEKAKLEAIRQQLEGARQNLEGVKKEVRVTP